MTLKGMQPIHNNAVEREPLSHLLLILSIDQAQQEYEGQRCHGSRSYGCAFQDSEETKVENGSRREKRRNLAQLLKSMVKSGLKPRS